MATNDLRIYNRAEYFMYVAQAAKRAKRGDRIAVATMAFDPEEPLVAQLVEALGDAAARGVEVYFAIDAYNFLFRVDPIPGPLWYRGEIPSSILAAPFKRRLHSLQTIADNGGHYSITNMPSHAFSNPYAGRSHIKAAVINSYLLVGGCNLQSRSDVDCMVGMSNSTGADWLYKQLTNMVATGSSAHAFEQRDRTFNLTENSQLLIDAGVPNQSTIYEHALQLIDDAREHVFITCQYFPGGKTAQHLLAAYKRGVDVRIVYSHPSAQKLMAPFHFVYTLRERMRLPTEFFAEERKRGAPLLHAKVIATEQGAMVGSHNYVTQGVQLGTAEIALLYLDPDFSRDLVQKIGSEL